MKSAERESFLKSFGVFFFSLTLLGGVVVYLEYFKQKHELQEKIYKEMRICSYTLKCDTYAFDFVLREADKLYQLQETQDEIYALFSIPKNDKYALKIALNDSVYSTYLKNVRFEILRYFLFALIVFAILSILFSYYTLLPLKKALHLTEEFSRDILHDLGTPLAVLRLNVNRLHIASEDARKFQRILSSIETIFALGDNLRTYLDGHSYQSQKIDLLGMAQDRVQIFTKLYQNIRFSIEGKSMMLNVNHDAIVRIIDNLLSNAAKYNKIDGFVKITIDEKNQTIQIEDSGRGIKEPKRVFERFYKEQERGLGIGLHIVKKLCEELKIDIKVESELLKGTIFRLDLKNIGEKNEKIV
ncbi:sensor histidine kinase [Sulfurimonas sp.]|uniref:sensor histidine kinase n=1 Tax=Sulfurimonas sp. TaxID=2022749 RepID=UPI003D1354FF